MEIKLSPEECRKAYWRSNLRILMALMSIWFLVSFGCGILFVDTLNKISIGACFKSQTLEILSHHHSKYFFD